MKTPRPQRLLILVGLLLAGSSAQPIPLNPLHRANGFHNSPCCGTQPVTVFYGPRHLFIPNVFTPNGDGYNDYFLPLSSDSLLRVRAFTILTAGSDSVLFRTSCIDYAKRVYKGQSGWNGRRPDGSCYQGRFPYQLWVEWPGGDPQRIEGAACALAGNPGLTVVQSKEGCLFIR